MFFSPNQPLKTSQRALPHWRQAGVIYFVTFRLGDSIPADKLRIWREERDLWLAQNGQPATLQEQATYDERFSMRLEAWLDAGMGSCLLNEKRAIETVASAMKHFDKARYLLDHWVIMPNHVHLLAMPQNNYRLSEVLHSWKSYTAKQLNQQFGRGGILWQNESYNRIVRNEAELQHYREYILNNPQKSGVQVSEEAISAGRIQDTLKDI